MPPKVHWASAATATPLSVSVVSAVLSLITIVLYGWSYLLALNFYSLFGITPEDVGWSHVRAISRIAYIWGTTILASLIVTVLVALAIRVGRALGRRLPLVRRQRMRLPRWLGGVTFMLMVLATVAVAGYRVVEEVRDVRGAARSVIEARETTDAAVTAVGLAGIDVPLAAASWVQPGADGPGTRSLVAFLGQANGTSIFYDLCTRSLVRVPTGDLALEQFPDDLDDDEDDPAVDVTTAVEQVCESIRRGGEGGRSDTG